MDYKQSLEGFLTIFLDGFLGINIGPNKDTKNKVDDYYICLSRLGLHIIQAT